METFRDSAGILSQDLLNTSQKPLASSHSAITIVISTYSNTVMLSSSRDIAQYRSNSPIYTAHKSTSVLYGKKHGIYCIYVSKTTQRTNTGQVPACSQEPVDFTDTNVVETSTCLKTTQQETTNFTVRLLIELDWLMFSCAPECSKQLPLRKYILN